MSVLYTYYSYTMAEKDEIKLIPLDDIIEPIETLRTSIDMEKIRELSESIREKGLLQPILVRFDGNKFEILAGHRRFLAHKMIGYPQIKSIVKEVNDEDAILIRATENLQREDLSPIEEAKVYGVLRDKLGYTVEDIARKMGKNRLTIKKYLNLLQLPQIFQNAADTKALSLTVANILLAIDDEVLQHYYLQNAVENGCSQKTAELWLADYQKTKDARYYEAAGVGMNYMRREKINLSTTPATSVFRRLNSKT